MYKEALIRNTYQGILANRPRDLTEEELEAIELQKQQHEEQQTKKANTFGGEEEKCGGEGEDGVASVVTPTNPDQQCMPLGLPPLAGGGGLVGRCPDSPQTVAPTSPQQQWRRTVVCKGGGHGMQSLQLCPAGNTSSSTLATNMSNSNSTTPNGPYPGNGGSLRALYTPTSITSNATTAQTAVVGGGGTAAETFSLRADTNTEAAMTEVASTAMSWVEDNEDEFYDQLELDRQTTSPSGGGGGGGGSRLLLFAPPSNNNNTCPQNQSASSKGVGRGATNNTSRRNNRPKPTSHNHNHNGINELSSQQFDDDFGGKSESNPNIIAPPQGPHKGGRVGKRRAAGGGGGGERNGGGGGGGQWRESTGKKGGGGGNGGSRGGGGGGGGTSNTGATSAPAGGRFDSLRR